MEEMMAIRPETSEFLHELERSSNRKLLFPNDLGQLLESARHHELMEAFDEAIFYAKFITRSTAVMKRIGSDGEGFDKLSAEVGTGIEKASNLLKSLSVKCSAEVASRHSSLFFSMNHEALENLMGLFADLTLVKNWVLDKKPLP
jgi:hypothetical protein